MLRGFEKPAERTPERVTDGARVCHGQVTIVTEIWAGLGSGNSNLKIADCRLPTAMGGKYRKRMAVCRDLSTRSANCRDRLLPIIAAMHVTSQSRLQCFLPDPWTVPPYPPSADHARLHPCPLGRSFSWTWAKCRVSIPSAYSGSGFLPRPRCRGVRACSRSTCSPSSVPNHGTIAIITWYQKGISLFEDPSAAGESSRSQHSRQFSDCRYGNQHVTVVPDPSSLSAETLSSMRLHQVLHDRESQPGSSRITRAPRIHAVITLEDAGQVLRPDAGCRCRAPRLRPLRPPRGSRR